MARNRVIAAAVLAGVATLGYFAFAESDAGMTPTAKANAVSSIKPDPMPSAENKAVVKYLVEVAAGEPCDPHCFTVNEMPAPCNPHCFTIEEFTGKGTQWKLSDFEPPCAPNCRYYRVTFPNGYPCAPNCHPILERVGG